MLFSAGQDKEKTTGCVGYEEEGINAYLRTLEVGASSNSCYVDQM